MKTLAHASAVLAALALFASSVRADEVDDLIELVSRKPAGMETAQWKEKRREAAIELGRRGDRRAVPALIEVVRAEKFDIVGENAIEALGKIGDRRAVDVLKRAANDDDRDGDARRAARRALAKLGASATPPAGNGDGDGGGGTGGAGAGSSAAGGAASGGIGSRILGEQPELPEPHHFSADTLAATEHLTLALGGVRFSYDTIRDTPSLDGDIKTSYERVVERPDRGTTLALEGGALAGTIDFPGDDSAAKTFAGNARGRAEIRFYFGAPPFYALGAASGGLSVTAVKIDRPMGQGQDTSETLLGVDGTLTAGVGFGRIFERGAELRVRRIAKALEEAHLLGRPITPDLTAKILATWWSLRGELSPHRQLIATIELLREAGVLLEAPSPTTTYEILQILLDGNLSRRPDGASFAVGFSETLLHRDDFLDLEDGRVENVVFRGRYGKQQAGGVQEIAGETSARYRILADDGEPEPWLAVASAAYRRYMYSDTYDPLGGIEIAAEIGASDDGFDGSDIATRIGGRVGWLFTFNQASQLRVAGEASLESGELFVGATLEASYGLLDVSFIGRPASL